jgi:hypothetical protein
LSNDDFANISGTEAPFEYLIQRRGERAPGPLAYDAAALDSVGGVSSKNERAWVDRATI